MADKVIIEAEVKSNIGEVSKDASGLVGEFQVMGVSLNGVKKAFVNVGRSAKASFATIKAGIASSGIGVLVLAVGSLATYFTQTKRGADSLSKGMAGLNAVFSVLVDRVSMFAEGLQMMFNPMTMRKGAKMMADAFKGIGAEIKAEAVAMSALEERTQRLRDAENEFMVQKAATRKEIEKARLIAEDETKAAAERLENLKKALALEEKTTQRELELARERMEIQREEMLLSENLVEDEQKLAELKTEIIEKETASIKMRRRVVTEVNALEREIQTEEKARAKAKQDIIDAEFEAKIKANDEWNKAQLQQAEEEIALAKRVAEEKIALEKFVEASKMQTIAMGFQAAGSLAKEGSAAAKGIAVAQTIFNTQQSIMKAMADVPYPYNIVQAALNGIMGASAVQKILSTDPTGGGASSARASGGGSQTPAPQMMSGAFDLTGGIEPEATRAYVLTDEMTNSQNQLANIRRRATI